MGEHTPSPLIIGATDLKKGVFSISHLRIIYRASYRNSSLFISDKHPEINTSLYPSWICQFNCLLCQDHDWQGASFSVWHKVNRANAKWIYSKMENCQLPRLQVGQSPSKEEGCEVGRTLDGRMDTEILTQGCKSETNHIAFLGLGFFV